MLEELPKLSEPSSPTSQDLDRVHGIDTRELLETAKFLGQDSDLRVFHRFDKLRLFLILRLQRRLADMTKELENLVPSKKAVFEGKIITKEVDEKLGELVQDIERTLKDYDNALLAQERIERFRKPDRQFMTAFSNQLVQYPKLEVDFQADSDFKLNTLVMTPMETKSWIHRLIDKNEFLNRRFATESDLKKGQKGLTFYSEHKIRHIDRIFVNVSFSLLVLCPIIILSLVESIPVKLSIVIGCSLFCAVLMSIATGVNNSGLAVLAGYSALLVFFLGVRIDLSSHVS